MRVVIFHPTMLPPKDYGGVERVVLWLAKGLVERGHETWVAASKGSRLPPGARLLGLERPQNSARALLPLLPKGCDVIHFMAPPEEEIWGRLPCAGVLTVHGNGKPGEVFPKNSVFLSGDHARRHRASRFIYNGIDPGEYLFEPGNREDWFLFLSKTSWRVKNLAGAMSRCAAAGVKLRIAGGQRPWVKRIEAMARPSMKWMGPVAGARKAALLARAKALVFPVAWPEPFGLVVAEALISGTPVLASRKGSLTELVPPDVGAVLDGEEQWISALRGDFAAWRPERCRNWAMEKFHFSVMAASYEEVYRAVLSGKTLHAENPVAGDWRQE